MIGRSLNADLRKMKGTSVILAHLLIPIITSVIFLIYYFFSPCLLYTSDAADE